MKFFYNNQANLPGIYKIVNTHTNRVYIGQAACFKKRWNDHKKSFEKGKNQNKYLLNDFKKCFEEFKHDNFIEFHVIEAMPDSTKEERKQQEDFYIKEHFDKQDRCYNFKQKSAALTRSVFSNDPDITKKILSEKSKAMWANPELRSKMLERKTAAMQTPEYKEALKKGLQEAWKSEKRRDKTSKRLKEEHASGSREHATQVLNANQKKGRKTFKERMKTDSDFKKKYQEIGRQNIAKRNTQQPKKKYPPLLSPDGIVYEVCGVPTFCKEHGLTKQLLYNVLNGKSKSHNGWALAS